MKKSLLILLSLLGAVGAFFFFFLSASKDEAQREPDYPDTNTLALFAKTRARRAAANDADAHAMSLARSNAPVLTNLPEPVLHAQKLMLNYAAAAKPVRFDPTIVAYNITTNRGGLPPIVILATRTHTVETFKNHVKLCVSVFDSQMPLDDYGRAHSRETWYQQTGTWTETAAVAETKAILQRLGATGALASVSQHVYNATPLEMRAPDGTAVRVTPFVKVTLINEKGRDIVTAEWRMGSTGPDGLTRWTFWP